MSAGCSGSPARWAQDHYLFWYYVILVIVVWGLVRNLLRTRYGRCLVPCGTTTGPPMPWACTRGLPRSTPLPWPDSLPGWPGPCTPICTGGWDRILHPAPLHHLSGHGHRGRPGHLNGSFWGPAAIRWTCRWKPLPSTPARYCRGLEPGHRLETLFLRPGDRAVSDVRTARDRQLVAHRTFIYQAVAVPILKPAVDGHGLRKAQ
jgi:hypothetical protein